MGINAGYGSRQVERGRAIMGFRQSGLQEAFFVPGDHAFRVWGYGTTDPLEEVLRPGYFGAGNMMHPGELIYLRMQAQPPARLRGPVPEPVHMALVMAVGRERNGAVRLRLVQDFGRTDARQAEAAAPLTLSFGGAAVEAPKRQRGRPAGSGPGRGRRPTATMPDRRRSDLCPAKSSASRDAPVGGAALTAHRGRPAATRSGGSDNPPPPRRSGPAADLRSSAGSPARRDRRSVPARRADQAAR
jgi:hypothetical protein